MAPAKEQRSRDSAEVLISRCLAGDERAWEQFVRQYSGLVYSIALKCGLSADDAADLVQNVFVIVLRRLETLQHVERFSAWLITIAHRESWRLQEERRDSLPIDDYDPVDESVSIESAVEDWERAALVYRALLDLGDRCRALIDRLFLRDPRPSYESIAADLGIAIGSIGPIRARCLRQLRAALESRKLADFGHT